MHTTELDFARDSLEGLWNVGRGVQVGESRDIDDAAERVGRGKIIDRSCLDNYGYPMRRELIFSFTSSSSPIGEDRPAILHTRVSDDLDDRLLLPTPSKLHTVNHTATNNYPRATFPFLLPIHMVDPHPTEMNALSLNLPLRTINYPCVIRQKVTGNCDIRIYRSYRYSCSLSRFLNDILIKILRSRRRVAACCVDWRANRSKCDVM